MLKTIAIPDSAISDCSGLRAKTEKIFQFSRVAAIFYVQNILVYHDPFLKPPQANRERRIITKLLEYIECPQYLRKKLFPLSNITAEVGILSPLATPHHIRSKDLKLNEIREAVVFLNQGRVLAEVGGSKPIEVAIPPRESLKSRPIRVTTKISKNNDEYKAIILQNPPKDKYWGYSVSSSSTTLGKILKNRQEIKIATSRSCQNISTFSFEKWKKKDFLIAFGGPYKGIPEILKAEGKKVSDSFDCCFSVLSKYGTRSLRLEEAMMITLSKLEDKIGF